MCGKYHITTEDENISFREAVLQLMRENPEISLQTAQVRPSQIAPVYTNRGLVPMRFGYKPPWMKKLLINARSETAPTNPLFSTQLKTARCLVPAHGFYEWTAQKQPFVFGRRQGGLLYMAGFYFHNTTLEEFVILTRDAQGEPLAVHPRMPVIFSTQELQHAWLYQDNLTNLLLSLGDYNDLTSVQLVG